MSCMGECIIEQPLCLIVGADNHSRAFLPLPMVGRKREWHCPALIVEIIGCAAKGRKAKIIPSGAAFTPTGPSK